MAHWAELDENNFVIQVVVGDNNDPAGDEGYSWIVENLGGKWIQTSYNSNFRKNFAGIEYFYDEELDAFIAPQPFESWILNEETCQWEAPEPKPESEGVWLWNEEELDWELPDFSESEE